MGKKYKGPPVKNGYRLLKVGETILSGDLVADVEDHQGGWTPTVCAGSSYTKNDVGSGLLYCRKISTPKASKASKIVWYAKFPSIHPKSTKADLVKLLQETVDQLNDLGAKWAKAQNTINALKKKTTK